ncbi:zinc-binding dehydrogenase [Hoeflea prorocentri]|uniref:Zinc-binding dehydrogenase n=1 Tax=Hoeflea prorocentri TaxID=1922333 RepID=A0A9X3UIS3_9HYPH|nr:zinc-binding dehydrogenase [Hoeflea prorocentri]MCY6379400.1 zinc-binding dehydrogenase [Hoeflea prorocentri]MDA5397201.1 zinc-binding dehydrogenase [Hoeflea prorocentri]
MKVDRKNRVLLMAAPQPDAVELVRKPLPVLGEGEALVRVEKAGICGTDLHIVGWNEWASKVYKPPFALGHELCGEICDIQGDADFRIGDRVSCETHLACGTCSQCVAGRGHTCIRLKTFSRIGAGAFCDYTAVPFPLLRKVPREVSDSVGACMEPLGISVRAATLAHNVAGSVLVSGCGPIGLFAVAALKALGAELIIASDLSKSRRKLALKAGARIAIDPREENPIETVQKETNGEGVGATIETSGASNAITAALQATAVGGTAVMAGLPAGAVSVDIAGQIVLREITLKGIYGRLLAETWDRTTSLLEAGLDISPLITDTYDLEDFEYAIQMARSGQSGKVVFDVRR